MTDINLIRAGDYSLADDSDNQFVKTYEISSVVKHPGYKGWGFKNDLAIAFTKTKIDFNARIGKILIPETKTDVTNGTEALFSAWMQKDYMTYDEVVFKTGYIEIFSNDYCVSRYGHEKYFKHMQTLCAGSPVSLIEKIVVFQKILKCFLTS